MPDLKKILTLEALSAALPSWLKRDTKPEYNADEIDSANTTNQFVSASDKDNWNAKGTYSKPFGGIPKSDLSSIVQTSLEKADSALQSETDPTVPSWAKQPNKPSYTQDEVADGSTYKRVTQTEKDTWSGKQNALTTTQMQAVNSGITSEGVAQISTNQTNVLSVQNKVGFNLFNFEAWKSVGVYRGSKTVSGNTTTITANANDAFTFIDVINGYPESALIRVSAGDSLIFTWDYQANDSQANDQVFICGNGAYDSYVMADASAESLEYLVPNGITYITIRLGVATAGNSATYSNLQIQTKESYNSGLTDYQPYGAPNYELTKLEAEDRSNISYAITSLRNLVDESDKNRVISNIKLIKQNNNGWSWVGNTASLNGVTITVNDDLTLVASGQMTASSALIFTVINRTTDNINIFKETGYHYIHGNLGDNSSSISFRCNYTGNNVPVEIAADTSGNGTLFKVTDEMKNSANGVWFIFAANSPAFSNVHLKPMICKYEDWYISNEYVPPVMSHTEAVKQINENTGKIQTLNDKMAELIDTKIYGFKISKTDNYPSTRVEYMYDAVGMRRAYMDYNTNEFNYGDWGDVWFVKENRPVALKYDRTVDYELDPTDYWKKKDGTASDLEDPTYAGNFMSEIPLIYVKRWEDDDYCYCAVSNKKVDDGFKADAFTKADGTISTHIYYPMFAGSLDSNNRLRSIAGVHYLEQTSIADEITYAENNGTNYQIKDISKHDLITDLLILMGKSTNIQFTFGIGITELTTAESDVLLSGYNVKDGSKATSAQFWGGIQNGTTFANDYRHIKVFHIEDFWGNAWQDTIGANLDANVYKVRTTPPYAVSPDATYQTLDVTAPSEDWVQQLYFNASGHLPTVTGSPASNTMCYCARFYKTATNIRSLLTGGSSTQGYKCSPFFYNFQNAVDIAASGKKRVYASLHTYSTTNVQGGA